MVLKVVALKPQNVSDQQFPVLSAHSDETSVEPVHFPEEWEWIKPQDLDARSEADVVR